MKEWGKIFPEHSLILCCNCAYDNGNMYSEFRRDRLLCEQHFVCRSHLDRTEGESGKDKIDKCPVFNLVEARIYHRSPSIGYWDVGHPAHTFIRLLALLFPLIPDWCHDYLSAWL